MKNIIAIILIFAGLNEVQSQNIQMYFTNLTNGSTDVTHLLSISTFGSCPPTFNDNSYTVESNAYTLKPMQDEFVMHTENGDIVYETSPTFEANASSMAQNSQVDGIWYNTGVRTAIDVPANWRGAASNTIGFSLGRLIRHDGWRAGTGNIRYEKMSDARGVLLNYQVYQRNGLWILQPEGNLPLDTNEYLSELMRCAGHNYS